ncbi:MAG TPA: flagellar export chaperone FliS [Bryobacteraceae bacterium]|jgi:flagellar protein FliS|nr:flagellar export chaperone FliS [Bryobacteraceae bacterium]
MSTSLHTSYAENEVLNAPPERLVQILYQLGIKAIVAARECVRTKDIAGRTRHINKAFDVTTELLNGLDYEAGAEIALNYGRLYDYCQRRLIEANSSQSDEILAEVQSLFEDLSEAWQIVVAKTAAERRHILYSAEPPDNAAELAGTISCVG